jgi:hypothetical protein
MSDIAQHYVWITFGLLMVYMLGLTLFFLWLDSQD